MQPAHYDYSKINRIFLVRMTSEAVSVSVVMATELPYKHHPLCSSLASQFVIRRIL